MAYTAQNLTNFNNALAGAIAGMFSGGLLLDGVQADYLPSMNVAQAFAQQFDTTWGATTMNALETGLSYQLAQGAFVGRAPAPGANPPAGATTPANYATLVNAMIACMKAGDQSNTNQGIPSQVATGTNSNYVFLNVPAASSIHTQTSANATVLATLLLQPKTSGVFMGYCNVGFADNTTAGIVAHNLGTIQVGAFATGLTGGLATNVVTGSGVNPGAAGASGMILNVDAAGGAGLQYNGVNINTLVGQNQYIQNAATLTGKLSAQSITAEQFNFNGLMLNSFNPKTPYTVSANSSPILFVLQMTSTPAHVITYGGFSFGIVELSAP